MRPVIAALAFVLALAGCGGGSSPHVPGSVDACALILSPQAMFGANADIEGGHPLDTMAGACSWRSADGARNGDLIVYTAQSLHGATPASQVAHFTQAWSQMTPTPLAPVAHIGDEAQIATDLPGYQTQIVFRKGDKVIAILAGSGDAALTSEALARQMAGAAAANL